MKDLFSSHAKDYSRYRPSYPGAIFQFLQKIVPNKKKAWDCATGNGQVAGELANFFEQVYATDISINQLSQAIQKENIHYTKQAAEKTIFPASCFDLVTVGQAVHWFEFKKFYAEVNRVLKKEAVIAIFGYGLFKSDPATNETIDHFYNNVIGKYWAAERRYLQEGYKTIPFPFKEIEVPQIEMKQHWSLERLLGYLNTWSAVKAYEKEKGENPVEQIKPELQKNFGEVGEVDFPLLMRIGRNS